MSLGREILRNSIRTLAFPVMLTYVLYKMYLKVKDQPGTEKLIEAYTKLWTWIRKQKKKPEEPQDQTNWV